MIKTNKVGVEMLQIIDGVSKILKDWSVHIHIPYKTLMSFYYRHSKDETIQYINDRIKQLGGEV